RIAACVESLVHSTYTPFEVIVVDDRSTDDTARIVSALSSRDARIRLVQGEELSPGWYGKPWACMQGFRAATGETLLFTDADTVHQPMLVPHAVAALEATGAGIVTISP